MNPRGIIRMRMAVIFLFMIVFIWLSIHQAQIGEVFKAWINMVFAFVCLGLIVVVKEHG